MTITHEEKTGIRLDKLKLLYNHYNLEHEDKERFAMQVFLLLLTVIISAAISFKDDFMAIVVVVSGVLLVIAAFFFYYHYFIERKILHKINELLGEIWKLYDILERG